MTAARRKKRAFGRAKFLYHFFAMPYGLASPGGRAIGSLGGDLHLPGGGDSDHPGPSAHALRRVVQRTDAVDGDPERARRPRRKNGNTRHRKAREDHSGIGRRRAKAKRRNIRRRYIGDHAGWSCCRHIGAGRGENGGGGTEGAEHLSARRNLNRQCATSASVERAGLLA